MAVTSAFASRRQPRRAKMPTLADAQELLREARKHKRLANFHRKRMRETFEELRRICDMYGFQLIDEGGDTSHGRSEDHTDP